MSDGTVPMGSSGPVFELDATPVGRSRWLSALANMPAFRDAAPATIERLFRDAVISVFAPGKPFFLETESARFVWFVLDGVVRVFQSHESGAEYTPKIFAAPAHFGELAPLAGHATYRSSAEPLVECVAARVPVAVLEECLASDHALCLAWVKSMASTHATTVDSDRQSTFGGVRARFANVLLAYADVFGAREGELEAIGHELSYANLARNVGCTRRTAITVMQDLKARGYVQSADSGWLVNRNALLGDLIPGSLSLASSSSKRR